MVSNCTISSMKPVKAMTIRLSADQSEELDTIATVDGQPISRVIRSAIAEHIEGRKRDARVSSPCSVSASSASSECCQVTTNIAFTGLARRGSPATAKPVA